MHQVRLRRGDGTDMMFSTMGHSTWFDFFSSDKGTSPPSIRIRWSCQWGMIGCTVFPGTFGDLPDLQRGTHLRCVFFCETRPWNQQGVLRLTRFTVSWEKNTSTSENKAAKIYRTNAKNYPNPSTFADSNQRPTPLLHLSPDVSVDLENCHWPTWARGSCQWSPPHQSREIPGTPNSGTPIPILLPIPLP